MVDRAGIPPCRRAELVFGPVGDNGQVIKDPVAGTYYNLGRHEAFLLGQLDGEQTAEEICSAFQRQFGEPLSPEDLGEFVRLATEQGFLQKASRGRQPPESAPPSDGGGSPQTPPPDGGGSPTPPPPGGSSSSWWAPQNILYWRKNFFDPDRFFAWLEPHIRFLWTSGFLVLSLFGILAAVLVVWANFGELVADFPGVLRWEVLAVIWLTMLVATFCHEFAHGLTCKHYGGEVHEVGFLFLFGIPCFYCNVSDAWLFPEKSRRLLVTLAGGYCDLCLGTLAVFLWRLTEPGTSLQAIALTVLTVCFTRTCFNLNPFLKLDGYYLLSDWAEIPNLRQRSSDLLRSQLRHILWGAPRPTRQPRGRFLLGYGLLSWLVSLLYLGLLFAALDRGLRPALGLVGTAVVAVLGLVVIRGLCQGLTDGELTKMILHRHRRTIGWLFILAAVPLVLWLIPMEERASGSFRLRSAVRVELRAPAAGFLRAVYADEGERVTLSDPVALIEAAAGSDRAPVKEAEIQESQARLRLLEVGPRQEVAEQQQRVSRARAWRDLAEADLTSSRQVLQAELDILSQQITEQHVAAVAARSAHQRNPREESRLKLLVCESREEQLLAQKPHRQAAGTRPAETELARRQKELADAESALRLLEVGTRPEETAAERARLARLKADSAGQGNLKGKVEVFSPIAGAITTPQPEAARWPVPQGRRPDLHRRGGGPTGGRDPGQRAGDRRRATRTAS